MCIKLFGLLLFSACLVNGQFGSVSSFGFNNFGGFNNHISSFHNGVGPFSSFGFGSGFGDFQNMFSSLGNNIRNQINQQMKPLKVTTARNSMRNGRGGVTIVEAGNQIILKKNGVSFRCVGSIGNRKPFCQGVLMRLETKDFTDYCNADDYYQSGDIICIAKSGQTGLSFTNNNGHYSCYGSDNQPAFMINLAEYQRLCGRMPWQNIYHYYPDSLDPLRVPLPDPDLDCQENRSDVCTFQPNSDI